MDVTLYPTRIFSHVGRVQVRVSSVRVSGSERGESGGGAILDAGCEKDGGGVREGERANERVGRHGTERNASVERAFIRAPSCLYHAPLSELSSEISNGCQRATA